MRILWRIALLGCFWGILPGNPAFAQSLAGCSGIDSVNGPKVVLDKLEFKNLTGATSVLTSESEIPFILELKSRLKNLFPDTQPTPVLCANRAPNSDGSDFVSDLVKTLHGRDVLLELWGTIKAREQNSKQALRADILMIIIPVRYYDSAEELDFHILSSTKIPQQDDMEIAAIKMTLGAEFDVYTSIAHGIKELKTGFYDKAIKYFANARSQWETAMEGDLLASSATDQKQVLAYIKGLEQKAITEAGADNQYTGDLSAVMDVIEERGP